MPQVKRDGVTGTPTSTNFNLAEGTERQEKGVIRRAVKAQAATASSESCEDVEAVNATHVAASSQTRSAHQRRKRKSPVCIRLGTEQI